MKWHQTQEWEEQLLTRTGQTLLAVKPPPLFVFMGNFKPLSFGYELCLLLGLAQSDKKTVTSGQLLKYAQGRNLFETAEDEKL